MGVEVVGGTSGEKLEVDITSKAARVALYDSTGNIIGTVSNPLKVDTTLDYKLPSSVGVYGASSFRIIGAVAASQVLMTIRNNAGNKDIAIRRLAVDVSHSAAAVDLVAAYFRFWANTAVTPTGGAAATKHKFDSAYPASQAETELLFAASADGVVAAITHATPASSPFREQAKANIMTAVGGITNNTDYELIKYEHHPVWVRSGETACLVLVGNANDVITRHYTVEIVWEEVTP